MKRSLIFKPNNISLALLTGLFFPGIGATKDNYFRIKAWREPTYSYKGKNDPLKKMHQPEWIAPLNDYQPG